MLNIDPRRRGFTLMEGLIASVVLAIAVVGVAGTLAVTSTQSSVMANNHAAAALAQQLMEEISAKPMTVASGNKPGWGAGATDKSTYDTLDDFSGYTDYWKRASQTSNAGTSTQPVSVSSSDVGAMGVTFASTSTGSSQTQDQNYQSTDGGGTSPAATTPTIYRRAVSFEYRSSPSGPSVPSGPFAMVTVTVQASRGGSSATLSRLFTCAPTVP